MIVGIFIVVYSSIDPINTPCLFSPIMSLNRILTYTGDGDDDGDPGLDDGDEGKEG